MRRGIQIKRPEWFDASVESALKTLTMIHNKKLPEALWPIFLTVSAFSMLRPVYGSDEETLKALRLHLDDKQRVEKQVADHIEQFPDGCGDAACPMCDGFTSEAPAPSAAPPPESAR